MFLNALLAAVSVATALAAPLDEHHGDVHDGYTGKITTLGQAAAQCGNHQQISCCNSGNKSAGNEVLGDLLNDILGGNCSPLNIAILGITVSIGNACTNQVACCTGDQNGLVNLACTQINL